MKPKVVILVSSDPRTSPRPAEAVRIAAGVGAWQKVEAILCLCGAAVLALGENVEELVDGESYIRYLPLVADADKRLYAHSEAAELSELGEAPLRYATIDGSQLADLVANSTNVLRF